MKFSKINKWATASLLSMTYALVLFASPVSAATVTNQITCTAPTTRTDGSALQASEIQKFTAYATRCTGETETINSNTCSFTDTFTISQTPCDTSYQVTSTDNLGIESDKSPSYVISDSAPAPSPPTDVSGSQTVSVDVRVQVTNQ